LVVDDIIIVANPGGAAGIQVVIRNRGNAAVNDEYGEETPPVLPVLSSRRRLL
jgi:hypothetical protein